MEITIILWPQHDHKGPQTNEVRDISYQSNNIPNYVYMGPIQHNYDQGH